MARPVVATTTLSTAVYFTRGEQFPLNNSSWRANQAIGYARGGQAKVVTWNTTTPRVIEVHVEMETKTIREKLYSFFNSTIQWMANTFLLFDLKEEGTDGV